MHSLHQTARETCRTESCKALSSSPLLILIGLESEWNMCVSVCWSEKEWEREREWGKREVGSKVEYYHWEKLDHQHRWEGGWRKKGGGMWLVHDEKCAGLLVGPTPRFAMQYYSVTHNAFFVLPSIRRPLKCSGPIHGSSFRSINPMYDPRF